MAQQRILVSGRVQGIGYRDWVVRTGQRGGLTGWVRNLRDGRVEIVASGEEAALIAFAKACQEGPPLARVEQVDCEALPDDKPHKGFTKRFTA
jgi:acylphosphatase